MRSNEFDELHPMLNPSAPGRAANPGALVVCLPHVQMVGRAWTKAHHIGLASDGGRSTPVSMARRGRAPRPAWAVRTIS